MPAPARFLLYVICLAAGLAVGRYLYPAKRSVLTRSSENTTVDASVQPFWNTTLEPVLKQPSAAEKVPGIAPILDRMKPQDFPPVAEAVRDDPALSHVVAARWAEIDPPGFFKYLAGRGLKSPVDHQLAGLLLYGWVQKDYAAATAAASRLRVPGAAHDSLEAICFYLLQTDAKKGLDFLKDQKLNLATPALLPALRVEDPNAAVWKGDDLAGRIHYFQSLPHSSLRKAALERLYSAWTSQNPKGVLLAAQDSSNAISLIGRALDLWMQQDPNAVSQFFQTEAKDEVRAAAGVALVARVAGSDPQQAWDFAYWFLSGAPRAAAFETVFNSIVRADPQDAAVRLSDLPDAPWRRRALGSLARRWHAKDSRAALDWIERDLPREDKREAMIALAEDPSLSETVRAQLRERFKLPDS